MTPEELFNKNQKLVNYCAMGFTVPTYLYEDLLQEGRLALWRACQDFDETRGFAFTTYAIPSIKGAYHKFCRTLVPQVKIPRSMFDDGTYRDVKVTSLDEPLDYEDSDSATLRDVVAGEVDFYPELFEDQIEDFLRTIPECLYHNIAEEVLYSRAYGDDRNQQELAEKYHCRQSTVSRYKSKAIRQFKEFLDKIDWR